MAKVKKATKVDVGVLTMNQDSFDSLQVELENRINVLRKDIADEISAARELGDLSENHAYSVAMEKKEMNENRILEIEDILAVAQVVIHAHVSTDTLVSIGEKVEIQNMETNDKRIVTIVGSEDSKAANSLEGKISLDSPMGKALYNAKVGEVVEVVLPVKTIKYKINKFVK
jgi:transcription elongation factor GreA